MKLRNKSGFTLIEMLAVIVIVVLLVIGIGTGINAAVNSYRNSVYESNCATLSDILNTTISDVLRYSENVDYESNTEFALTSYDFGISGAKLAIVDKDNAPTDKGYVALYRGGDETQVVLVVNEGAYSKDLYVTNLNVTAEKSTEGEATEGGGPVAVGYYYTVSYTIGSDKTGKSSDYSFHVRQSNADIVELVGKGQTIITDGVVADDGVSYIVRYHANCSGMKTERIKDGQTIYTSGRVIKKLNVFADTANQYIPSDAGSSYKFNLYGHDNIVCSNYTFKGWATAPDGNVVFDPGKEINLQTFRNYLSGSNRILDLYAKWSYTITFDANASKPTNGAISGSMSSVSVNCSAGITLPACGYTKTGTLIFCKDKDCTQEIGRKSGNFAFCGWNKSNNDYTNDGNTAVKWNNGYAVGYNLTDMSIRTLYAEWAKSVNISYLTDSDSAVKNNKPTGWHLDGWVQKGSSEAKTGSKYVQDKTNYVFMGLSRQITFDVNGGNALSDSDKTKSCYNYKSPSSISSFPTPKRTNYVFEGWYTQGGTKITTSNIDTAFTAASNGSVTLYAHWKERPLHNVHFHIHNYTVSYSILDETGATVSSGSLPSQAITTGGTLGLPDKTLQVREGYQLKLTFALTSGKTAALAKYVDCSGGSGALADKTITITNDKAEFWAIAAEDYHCWNWYANDIVDNSDDHKNSILPSAWYYLMDNSSFYQINVCRRLEHENIFNINRFWVYFNTSSNTCYLKSSEGNTTAPVKTTLGNVPANKDISSRPGGVSPVEHNNKTIWYGPLYKFT